MYPGFDGFLGTRASFMLDVVALAMLVVLPIMAYSIYQVRVRKNFLLHKRLQLGLGLLLLAAVTLFEIDIRVHGWRERAQASRYFLDQDRWSVIDRVLAVHLFFAVSTTVLWIVVIARALRNFPNPPLPGPHSPSHRLWAWLAAIDMACTSVTGWTFYYVAFVA